MLTMLWRTLNLIINLPIGTAGPLLYEFYHRGRP